MSLSRTSHGRSLTECRSGELNAKDRELAALQAQARARLATTKVKLAEGMKTARQVQSDLDWTQKKMQYARAGLVKSCVPG